MIKNILQQAKQKPQQQQQHRQQQITADAAGKNHFLYTPVKMKKGSTLSNP